jgi:hypothetical protein
MGLTLALIGGGAASARAQGPLFEFLDIRNIDRTEIEVRAVETDPPPLRESEAFLSERLAPASPDKSLGLPVSRIGLDAAGLRSVPMAPLGSELDVRLPMLELTIAGFLVRMPVIEVKTDRDFDALHYTLLARDSGDYARLTVSLSGPEIVGTFFIDDAEYRILPEDDEYQLVYPVVANNGLWRRDDPVDLQTRAGQLEARHLQIGWIADSEPGRFDTFPDGRPSIYGDGPSLGKLAFWSAIEFNAAGDAQVDETILKKEVENYLNAVPYFTWVPDPVEVRVDEVGDSDMTRMQSDGIALQVTQLMNGIPISQPLNLRMGPSGDVVAYSGVLARYDMLPPTSGEVISRDDARETSAYALQETLGIQSTGELDDEELFYHSSSGTEFDLIWRTRRKAQCGIVFQIDIDATTGSTLDLRIVDSAGIRGRTTEDTLFRCRWFRAFD